MAELTKKDIKEAVTEVLKSLVKEIHKDFKNVHKEFGVVKNNDGYTNI